jgi:hypothetical protein
MNPTFVYATKREDLKDVSVPVGDAYYSEETPIVALMGRTEKMKDFSIGFLPDGTIGEIVSIDWNFYPLHNHISDTSHALTIVQLLHSTMDIPNKYTIYLMDEMNILSMILAVLMPVKYNMDDEGSESDFESQLYYLATRIVKHPDTAGIFRKIYQQIM